ncbi:MAG TPA: type IX secretion system membrane protein PorP/SprF [Luteibaculaceae bacterium]|nr:type IX secretion system membrane protein PorP/SprF [Luteibaculaceae bacterium]
MKKIYFATLLFLLSAGAVHSQQQQLLSLYQFYKQGFNPGYIGQNGPFQAVMDYRNQWVRSEGAPESINLGVDGLFGYKRGSYRHAIGAIFSGDKIGVSTENRLGLQYAYRLPVSKSSTLSFGVQVAYQQSRHDFNKLLAADAGDALAEERVTNNEILPGAGLYLNGNRYFAGISIPNLIKDTKDLEGNDVALNRFRHLYLMGGYVFKLSPFVDLRTSALFKTTRLESGSLPGVADINIAPIFYQRFLIGVSYRTDETVVAITQIQLTRNLRIGYGYDFNTGKIGLGAGGSHEIMLGFNVLGKNSPFTNPRFISYF